jgi:hypothetical protein
MLFNQTNESRVRRNMRPTSKALKKLCQTIGIIGNGQLARMLALSAYNLGFKIAIYAEDDNGPANLVTKFNTIGNFNDTKK